MLVEFNTNDSVWVADLHKLAEAGVHFACLGEVIIDCRRYFIVCGYGGREGYIDESLTSRLTAVGLFEDADWIPIPRE